MLEYVKEEKQITALLAAWCLPTPLLAPRETPLSHHHGGDTEQGEAALWAGGKAGQEDRAGVSPAPERKEKSQEPRAKLVPGLETQGWPCGVFSSGSTSR